MKIEVQTELICVMTIKAKSDKNIMLNYNYLCFYLFIIELNNIFIFNIEPLLLFI